MQSRHAFTRKRGGYWTAYYYVSTGKGRRQRSRGGFRSKREATEWLTETMALHQAGVAIEPSRLTLGEYLEERWLPVVEHSLRPSTFDSYQRIVALHVIPHLGWRPIQELRADELDALYARLLKSGHRRTGGLAPRTVHHVHTMMHRALRDAERKGLVLRNVVHAADPPRVRKSGDKEMRTWTGKQLRSFLESIRDHDLFPAFLLASTTGMRRGEVLGVRVSDVDFRSGRLAVRQTVLSVNYKIVFGTPKTTRSRRSIALDPATLEVLREHCARQARVRAVVESAPDLGLVFTRPTGEVVHPDYFSQLFDRLVIKSGLPKIRLHDLRHTHATLGLAAGIPAKVISDRLGHANVGFTQDVYMHAIPQVEADSANKIARLVFGRDAVTIRTEPPNRAPILQQIGQK